MRRTLEVGLGDLRVPVEIKDERFLTYIKHLSWDGRQTRCQVWCGLRFQIDWGVCWCHWEPGDSQLNMKNCGASLKWHTWVETAVTLDIKMGGAWGRRLLVALGTWKIQIELKRKVPLSDDSPVLGGQPIWISRWLVGWGYSREDWCGTGSLKNFCWNQGPKVPPGMKQMDWEGNIPFVRTESRLRLVLGGGEWIWQ